MFKKTTQLSALNAMLVFVLCILALSLVAYTSQPGNATALIQAEEPSVVAESEILKQYERRW